MKDKFKMTVNPESGKILIGSVYNIMDAVDAAISCLNDPAYKDRDIQVYCDYGVVTVIELPAATRNATYTRDEIWDMIEKKRSENAAEYRRKLLPSP